MITHGDNYSGVPYVFFSFMSLHLNNLDVTLYEADSGETCKEKYKEG